MLKEGAWVNSRFFSIHYRPSGRPCSRWAVVVSRRVGKAVTRNLVKRRIREVCRLLEKELPAKWDIVVIGRKGSDRVKFSEMKEDLKRLCRKGNLL